MANGRLTFGGESKYLNGVNYPWSRYARDFGHSPFGPHEGVSTHEQEIRDHFTAMAAMGVHNARWFVFGNGSGGIHWKGGLPSALDATFFEDMDAALQIARETHVTINFVLLDHTWMFDTITQQVGRKAVPVKDINGNALTGHPAVLTSDAGRAALVERIFLPIFERYGPNGVQAGLGVYIAAFEVMNEPDWVTRDLHWNRRRVHHPMSLGDLRQFVRMVADAVHANTSSLVTLGGGRARFLTEWDTDVYGLDFLEVHQYSDDNDLDLFGERAAYSALNVTRPLVIGEFAANNDPKRRSLRAWKDFAYDNGYAGGRAWSFMGRPTTGDRFGAADQAEEKRWSADHSTDIFMFGG